jgi:uncharacterized hydrophobic protein (TIGR00341 family)
MALRLIEMVCPEERGADVDALLEQYEPLGLWHDRLLDGQIIVKILLPAQQAEPVLDSLEGHFGGMEGFRVLLLPVQAAVPRPERADEEGEAEESLRISRQELRAEVSSSADLTGTFLAMIALSSIVAAVGIWRNNVAVIIGAMVIAPLLGPNMALAFANTLGDTLLGRRALRTNLTGIAAALVISVALGAALRVSPDTPELALRARASLPDLVLALAAGCAGALAFTSGIHTPLVGVMVAVALLPPLVAAGLSLGAARWSMALGAFLLFLTNLICVNLAGIVTFRARGIRPRTWWETDQARRAARKAVGIWLALLLALVAAILLSQRWFTFGPA